MAHQHKTRRRNGIKHVPWTTCVIANDPEKLAMYDAVSKHDAAHGGHTSIQTCWCGAQKFAEVNGGSMVSGRWIEASHPEDAATEPPKERIPAKNISFTPDGPFSAVTSKAVPRDSQFSDGFPVVFTAEDAFKVWKSGCGVALGGPDVKEESEKLNKMMEEAMKKRATINGSIDGEPAQCIDQECPDAEVMPYHDHPEDKSKL